MTRYLVDLNDLIRLATNETTLRAVCTGSPTPSTHFVIPLGTMAELLIEYLTPRDVETLLKRMTEITNETR